MINEVLPPLDDEWATEEGKADTGTDTALDERCWCDGEEKGEDEGSAREVSAAA